MHKAVYSLLSHPRSCSYWILGWSRGCGGQILPNYGTMWRPVPMLWMAALEPECAKMKGSTAAKFFG